MTSFEIWAVTAILLACYMVPGFVIWCSHLFGESNMSYQDVVILGVLVIPILTAIAAAIVEDLR